MLLFAAPAAAQDATMNGIVMDESKAVLPGANVVATSRSTGRVFDAVTNERGEYRLAGMPPGRYDMRVELAGFAIVVLSDVELLVGQNATIPFTLKLATLDETVTVTGESPLIDLRTARVAGNIDRRQMEQLPIAGRNWMQLSMMVPGITANAVTDTPGISGLTNFQLNLDGQEITQSTSVTTFGQPGISREAIGEYQVVTNMFDVTNGRSAGIQVQAITRSGTNDFAGSVYGYFRDDKFNAADAFLNRVLPVLEQPDGRHLRRPDHQEPDALLRVVRARARAEHGGHQPAGAGAAADHDADRGEEGLLPRPLRRPVRRSGPPRGARQRLQALPARTTASPPTRAAAPRRTSPRTRARPSGRTSAPGTCCRNSAAASTSSTGPTRVPTA